jgi:hypothetical protein
MPDTSYYAKVNQLGRYLSRDDERGYSFACATDQRLIPGINREIGDYLRNKAQKKLQVLTLNPDGTQTLLAQLETFLREQSADALIVNGVDALLEQPDFLQNFNYAREALNDLNIPLLFWATDRSLARIGNAAADLFTQRRLTTVYFDEKPELFAQDPHLDSRFAAETRNAEQYEALQLRLNLLKQQMAEAQANQLSRRRIALDYALPIAKVYAALDIREPLAPLLDEYGADWTRHAQGQELRDAARVARSAFRYEQALIWLQQLCQQEKATDNPENSLLSVVLSETGDLLKELGRFQEALQYYQDDLLFSERLAKANPHSEQLQRDLGIAIEKLADLETSLGQLEQARQRYALRLEISERLSKANPHSEQLQRDYAVGAYKYAEILVHFKEMEQAEQYYEICYNIYQYICSQNTMAWQHWEDLGFLSEQAVERLLKHEKEPERVVFYISKAAEAYEKAFACTGFEKHREKAEQYRAFLAKSST